MSALDTAKALVEQVTRLERELADLRRRVTVLAHANNELCDENYELKQQFRGAAE